MTVTRRMFSTALILTGLCLALAPQASWAIDGKLLPEKTEIVVRVNLKQIFHSELSKSKHVQEVIKEIKDLFQQIPDGVRALKYLDNMGFDPARDLTALTLAHPATKNAEDLFFVIEGNFDPVKIEGTARQAVKDFGNILAITRIDNVTVFEINGPQGGGGVFIGLLGKKTILATGSHTAMKDAIARSQGKKPAALKKDVENLLKTVHDQQSVSFVASRRAMTGGDGGRIQPGLPVLDGGLSGSITFGKELTFQIGIAAKDQATARDWVDKGNIALFSFRAFGKDGPLMDFANTLVLTDRGNNAILEGEVSYETLQQLFRNLGDQFKGK